MTKEELAKLLTRYNNGTCTEAEKLLVESLHIYSHAPEGREADDLLKDEIWQGIEESLPLSRRKRGWPLYGAAAIILFLIGFGIMHRVSHTPSKPVSHQLADIPAGGNKATLKLGNGLKIELDSLNSGVAIHPSTLTYLDGSPVTNQSATAQMVSTSYHELATPKGGQYQVRLSDGTRVWLNAASSLRFPSEFAKDYREVEISGEAYLEIAKDASRPFQVKTKTQKILVLGTSFNVQAYPDEQLERTTLITGKIKIESKGFSEIIHPGYCAAITASGSAIQEADIDEATAWKSGYISFNEQTLENIMQQISRWYDVSITYQDVNPSLRFGGRVSRYANVSEVLKRLELTEQVRFKIYERRIVVTKY